MFGWNLLREIYVECVPDKYHRGKYYTEDGANPYPTTLISTHHGTCQANRDEDPGPRSWTDIGQQLSSHSSENINNIRDRFIAYLLLTIALTLSATID